MPSTRPEFAALLNQLRGIDEQAPRPAESWSAAPAWQAPVEPIVAEPFVAEPIAAEPYVAEPVETLAVDPAPAWSAQGDSWTAPGDASGFDTSTVRGPQLGDTEADLDFVETIRRQAQAAIDHAFGAGAMAQEAQRMQEAAAAIPLPRAGVPEASVPIAFDASPLPPLGFAVEVTDEIADAVEHLPDDDARLVTDRATLVALGVPQTWAATLRSGDRYSAVWQMLENLPPLDVDPDAPVVAVVGSPDVARLEAHRVAIDLAEGVDPRPVIVVPATGETQVGAPNQACVVAIETDGTGDPSQVLETLGAIRPDVVLVVLDAATPQAEARRWLFSLGAVDGIALDGVAIANQPAALLGLGVPVTRLDGIPIDRMTWTALLCAQLEAARPAI